MNLRHLSDALLERNLSQYAQQERKILSVVIHHISEFDSRRLYLKLGYASLFEYLTIELKYSTGAAQRRIEAARLLKIVPTMAEKIHDGRLQLSNIGELARAVKQKESESKSAVTVEQKKELLSAIENVSIAEAQRILAKKLDLELKPAEKKTVQKDESVHLQITLTKEQYEKLLQCRDLASHSLLNKGDLSFATSIEYVCDRYLKGKMEGNQRKESKTGAKQPPKSVASSSPAKAKADSPLLPADMNATSAAEVKTNRTLTPKMRQMILTKYRHCQHIDPKMQRKCSSRFLLQVDHRIPKWAGGDNSFGNLTLLCATHNQEKYRRQSFRD